MLRAFRSSLGPPRWRPQRGSWFRPPRIPVKRSGVSRANTGERGRAAAASHPSSDDGSPGRSPPQRHHQPSAARPEGGMGVRACGVVGAVPRCGAASTAGDPGGRLRPGSSRPRRSMTTTALPAAWRARRPVAPCMHGRGRDLLRLHELGGPTPKRFGFREDRGRWGVELGVLGPVDIGRLADLAVCPWRQRWVGSGLCCHSAERPPSPPLRPSAAGTGATLNDTLFT